MRAAIILAVGLVALTGCTGTTDPYRANTFDIIFGGDRIDERTRQIREQGQGALAPEARLPSGASFASDPLAVTRDELADLDRSLEAARARISPTAHAHYSGRRDAVAGELEAVSARAGQFPPDLLRNRLSEIRRELATLRRALEEPTS